MRNILIISIALMFLVVTVCLSETQEKEGISGMTTEKNVSEGTEQGKPPQPEKPQEKKVTQKEAHQFFAVALNNKTWGLLGKADRTPEDNREMIHIAHSSCYHWRHVGTAVNQQRGEWLIAHVYTVLGMKESAVYHAQLCLELTEKHMTEMADFDVAYAWEGMARAYALKGDKEKAVEYKAKARKFGDAIKEAEDKKIFDGDFSSGNWHGVN